MSKARPKPPTILDAVADPQLFKPWFRDAATWRAWFTFLAALFALPMTREQLATYRLCTGREAPPTRVATEAWLICGRRAGKSFVLGLAAVFLAAFHNCRQFLAPGERGTVLVIAADRRQARIILRYIRALLRNVPMLARLIERETAEAFDLANSVTIEVATASFKSVRGYTIAAALLDELAFWPSDDAASPDYEIIAAIKPGMVTVPNAMLLCASSPYARRGALWTAHKQHFGKDDDPVLVWQAPTRTMNPTVSERVIAEAMERDAASARAEFFAEFRTDIASFVAREIVEACVDVGVHERAPDRSKVYTGFTDPSGGSSDSMTLAIGHAENQSIVVDCVREIPAPFDPASAVDELVKTLRSYNVSAVHGDRYASQWNAQAWRKQGIDYRESELPRTGLYLDLLPQLNSKTIKLLDNVKLVNQIAALERRTSRGGRDLVDHPPAAHDDLANAVAGVASIIATQPASIGALITPEILDQLRLAPPRAPFQYGGSFALGERQAAQMRRARGF